MEQNSYSQFKNSSTSTRGKQAVRGILIFTRIIKCSFFLPSVSRPLTKRKTTQNTFPQTKSKKTFFVNVTAGRGAQALKYCRFMRIFSISPRLPCYTFFPRNKTTNCNQISQKLQEYMFFFCNLLKISLKLIVFQIAINCDFKFFYLFTIQ